MKFTPEYVDVAFVMPSYKVKCLKCRKTKPCHKHWYNKSYVLCPSCYFKMDNKKIEQFHERHKAQYDKAKAEAEAAIKARESMGSVFVPSSLKIGAKVLEEIEEIQTVSESFIREASKEDLLKAVRKGRLSKVRARIELRRRKNPQVCADLPDIDECKYLNW